MSKRVNELAQIVLDKMWKLGYQHRGLIDAHAETADRWADATAERDKLAAEIETLRAQLADAKRESSADSGELERLRMCVQRVCEHVELFEDHPASMRTAILQDLADCDTANPAPVSEPMDAEGGE